LLPPPKPIPESLRITAIAGSSSLSLDGRFAFQTTYDPADKALIQTKQPAFMRAYLTWRLAPGGGRAEAKLWVIIDDWIFDFADDFRLYARLGKGKADPETDLSGRIAKEGFNIFEVDPLALLAAYPDQAEVQLITHRPGKKTKSGQFAPPKGRINLALLRAQVAAIGDVNAALDREQARLGACKNQRPSDFEEADLANWNFCTVSQQAVVGGPPGVWSDGSRVTSQIWLGKGTLSFVRDISDGEDGHPFLAGGFAAVRILPYQLQFSAHVYAKPQRLTLTSGTETLTFAIAQSNSSAELSWADMMRLDKTGAEIKYRQAYDNGTVLSEGSLPAGSFSALESQMQAAYRLILDKRKDPIKECSPPPPIIVT
jgi:hypothetical protein